MVSNPLLSSLLSHLRPTRTRKSCARVFSDTFSPSQAFEIDLAASLQKLTQGDISSPDLMSFNWMCKALDVVISTQASVKQALHSHARAPGAVHLGIEMSKMMTQYIEDSVKMLDVCCLLKEVLAGANAYARASHLALKRLQSLKLVHEGDIERAKHDILSAKHVEDVRHGQSTKRLTACCSMLRRMGDKLTAPILPMEPLHFEEIDTGSMVSSALYGGELCTLFFLRFLLAALSSPASCPRKSSSFITPLHMSRQSAWTPSLLSLQAQLHSELLQTAQGRTQKSISLLPELHILQTFMSQIYETLPQISSSKQGRDDLKHLVDSTAKLICNMQISIARLQQQIQCIFSSLVDTRMAMLD